ncbi:MAG: hypothetical protein H0V01_06070 [Bacteroidetes bacterium]|nr:hypothetical protein [Bacteroidota bacterium]HET6244078.1 DNA-formamidopyrimidine glycosylase family protein [Bacteroidia bacterium]
MPELPDVEQFKKYADSTIMNQQIKDVEFIDKRMIAFSEKAIKKTLKEHQFINSKRIGKFLLLETDDEMHKWLVLHFGMTGELEYFKDKKTPKYARMLIHFKNGYHLSLNDPRLLGKIDLADNPESYQKRKELGVDALDVSEKQFKEILGKKKSRIKPTLMNQHLITGIGNVYADEILFQSKIHPTTNIDALNNKTLGDLYKNMQMVLKTAIKDNADPKKFPDSFLIPNRRTKGKCPNCAGNIKKIKVAGRGTYFCPSCQGNG